MIRLEQITKSFGSLQVLRGIDLEIQKGEVVSIVGPSGAGKTTLLQIMGTLDRPDTGTVCIDGVCVDGLKERELSAFRNRRIGFVFQFHQLLPEFTALENVMIPAFIAGQGRHEVQASALEMLTMMGLADRVLADEPSGSLDTHNKAELHQLFFDLRDRLGQTFVIVTHDESLASITDRTIHLKDGEVVADNVTQSLGNVQSAPDPLV